MIRCPRCGLRVDESRDRCPRDGQPLDRRGEASQEPEEDSPGEVSFLAAGYALVKPLGRGGFGSVFECERAGGGERLAIKIAHAYPKEAAYRLDREYTALQEIGPPHVPAVYEQGLFDRRRYFAMEYIEGCTLAERMAELGGTFSLEEVRAVAFGILSALSAVHDRGLIHCDLKPENVVLERGSRVRLIDFGTVCRSRARDPEERHVERPVASDSEPLGCVGPGTAEYMSPEQCEGSALVDARSDLYAFGVIFHEMLAGVPPFWGSAAVVREAHRSRRPLLARSDAATLWRVVSHCLAKEAARRPADARALAGELADAFARDDVQPAGASPWGALGAQETTGRRNPPDKCLAAILFFESRQATEVARLLEELGGSLAYSSGAACAAVFGPTVSDNPARAALRAARVLVDRSHCVRCLVDLGVVSALGSHHGPTRYFSVGFSKRDRYPRADDPRSVLLTRAVAEVLDDVSLRPFREGVFEIMPCLATADETAIGREDDLVGRTEITRNLLRMAQDAKERSCPAVALVTGDSGFGKTHLLRDLALRMQTLSIDVIRVHSSDHAWGSRVTSEQVLRACLEPWPVPSGDARPAFLRDLLGQEGSRGTWAAISLVLGWLPDDHAEVRTLEAAPGALRSALTRGLAALLRIRARRSATALLLDGAEMADDAMLEALELVSRRSEPSQGTESDCPLFILASARPGFARDRRDWGRSAPLFRVFDLEPLCVDAARELSRRLLEPAEHVPEWAIEKLVARTQGVPGLLVELVRGLKRDGLLRRHERGTGFYFAGEVIERLPEMPILRWSTQREVESLEEDLVAHARLASILGGPFQREDVEGLLFLLEQDGKIDRLVLDVGVALSRLLDAHILVRRRCGSFEFRTTLLREAVYEAAPESFRAQVHKALFRLLASHGEPGKAEMMAKLAFHAAKAGCAAEARARYGALGERALERQSYQDAATMLDLALAQAADVETQDGRRSTARLTHLRGLARFRLGRFEEAASDFGRASELSEPHGDQRLESLLAHATVADWMREFEASKRYVDEARRLYPMHPPERLAVEMLLARGRACHRDADQRQAAALLAEAADRAERLGDEGYEIMVASLVLCGFIYPTLGRLDDAERALQSAFAAAEAHDDHAHMAAALNNRVTLWFARADTARLLADLEQVLQIARASGLDYLLGPVEGNLAEALYCMGELDRAREHASRALAEHARVGASVRTVNTAQLLLARIELAADNRDAARACLQAMRSREECEEKEPARRGDDRELLDSDRLMLEALNLALDGADQDAWQKILDSGSARGLAPHEWADLHDLCAMTAFRAGRVFEARSAWQRAIQIARESAPILLARLSCRSEYIGTRQEASLAVGELDRALLHPG